MKPEFRVYLLDTCLINPTPEPRQKTVLAVAPLLALFVPKLVELAIGGVATLLKKAGGAQTMSVIGHESADFYVADEKQALQVNKAIGCILGVWGSFDDEDHGRVATIYPVKAPEIETITWLRQPQRH